MKKCQPGVICIENVTLFFILITLVIVGYLIMSNMKSSNSNNEKREKIIIREQQPSNPYFFTKPTDVLMNPYTPPLKDDRYITPSFVYSPPGTVPINVSTSVSAVDTNYRQVGILTPLNNSDKILPLMGRPLYTSRQKWQYYTMSDQNNSIKLPLSVKGKSATNDYGVDELYGGDTVYVEGYNNAYKVTVYDNNTMKYLPFL